MHWEKIGLIFCPSGEYDWMHSHAQNPVAEYIGDDCFRIFFSSRDRENRSSIAFVDIDINDPTTILCLSETPVLAPGLAGAFDDSGVSMGCIIESEGESLIYYLGWNLGVTVPWRNSIGLAVRRNGAEAFEKVSLAPVLDRNHKDPYSLTYPWVLRENNVWKMWYGSSLTWGATRADFTHVIKYA